MKSPYVGELVPCDNVTGHFLVLSKEVRQKKSGEPYLTFLLSDRTGDIEAKMWDNVAEVMDTFERDDFVKVKGLVQVYQNRTQFTVHRLRKLEDHEVESGDFFPCSEYDTDSMFAELTGMVAGMQNVHLRALVQNIFNDSEVTRLYKLAPAAKSIHHACRGGLLEHVISLCRLSRLMSLHYKNIDADLLLTGAILHDIGKIEELTYARSFGYSAEGQLLGHIVIGMRMVGKQFDALPDFPPKLRSLVEHMIISHHGELEFGSPKTPIFPEALLLHHLDNLDSKIEAMRVALKRDHNVVGDFTGWVAPLERILLKKDRYLNGAGTATPAADPLPSEKPAVEKPAAVVPIEKPVAIAEPAPEAPPAAPIKPAPPDQLTFPQPGLPIPNQPRPADLPRPAPRETRPPQTNTFFGEKLQAVLHSKK